MAKPKAPTRSWRLPPHLKIISGSPGYRLECTRCVWTSHSIDPAHDMALWRSTADGHVCHTSD